MTPTEPRSPRLLAPSAERLGAPALGTSELAAAPRHRRCPSCGDSKGGRVLTEVRLRTPDGHPLGSGYPVVCCASCGTGFADVDIPIAYYEHYYGNLAKYAGEIAVYRKDSATETPPVAPVDPDWLAKKADDSARRIDALLESKDARVLDVGCSTGTILGALARLGYDDLTGIDPSPDSVRLANARGGIRAEVGAFSTLSSELGAFDCICVTGVLEHLWDVDAAVLAVRGLLAEGGFIYVEVPDAGRYLDPYISPFEDFSTEHVNHFSLPGLRRLGARLGLETFKQTSYLGALTANVSTGCVAVAWRVGEVSEPEPRDDALEATLVAFTERSARDFAAIETAIDQALEGCEEYVLWGIGEAAFKLLALPSLAERHAVAYVDGNPARRGFRFGGVPIIPPSDLADGHVPIIAGSLIRADSIAAASARLGLSNPLVRLDNWRSEDAGGS